MRHGAGRSVAVALAGAGTALCLLAGAFAWFDLNPLALRTGPGRRNDEMRGLGSGVLAMVAWTFSFPGVVGAWALRSTALRGVLVAVVTVVLCFGVASVAWGGVNAGTVPAQVLAVVAAVLAAGGPGIVTVFGLMRARGDWDGRDTRALLLGAGGFGGFVLLYLFGLMPRASG